MRSAGVLAVLASVSMLAGHAVAPEVPNWDWQATFTFDGSGNIDSRTLDASSGYWLDCSLALTQIANTDTTTTDTTHIERVLVDTANKITGKVVQKNGNINEKRWTCVGAQITLGNPGGTDPHACYVSVLGASCSFSCTKDETISVDVSAGWSGEVGQLNALCGDASAQCTPTADLHCTDTGGKAQYNQTGVHNCWVSGVGIWPIAKCVAA